MTRAPKMTGRLRDLYYYAISCSWSAIVGHAARSGRGWYYFVDGELIVAAEIAL